MGQVPAEIAILVHLKFASNEPTEVLLEEFAELVYSAGVRQTHLITGARDTPEARFYVGTGKAQQIADAVLQLGATVVIINHLLSPAQERNLERLVKCRVLDRTGLILDIFAQRARTFEGKLQVELAQLTYLSTRLVRGWTHLERQKGGIGLRGPGETQLELDRRLLGGRIKNITQRLQKVRRQRELGRAARDKADIPTVSLVGYTNAGKSTLFNRLTCSNVYAADKLFATLDPTLRKVELAHQHQLIVVDTVGFIRDLPHGLVEAFRATLEETQRADLLLHVIDAASGEVAAQIQQVQQVLVEIGADKIPLLEVYNKIDKLPACTPKVECDVQQLPVRVWLSAAQGVGLMELEQAMSKRLYGHFIETEICLTPAQGRLRAEFYASQAVLREEVDEAGHWHLLVRMPRIDFERLVQLGQLQG